MSMDMRDFLKTFNMRKINKNITIALICMLMGMLVCQDFGYAKDIYVLRVPVVVDEKRWGIALHKALSANVDYAKAVKYEQELLSGIIVDEDAIREVFYNLALIVFSPKGLVEFNKINDFYDRLKTDGLLRDSLLQDSDKIASDYLSKLPFVWAVFPAGQFYCNMYDPVARRFLSFMQLARGEIDEFTYLRRDLPDYDFIHIFELPENAQWALERDADEKLRVIFKEMLENNPEWVSIAENLLKDFKISSIKLTSSVQERENTVEEFAKRNAIALCLSNPIPSTIWSNLHLFVCKDDYKFINSIRDLMIGLDEPIYAKQYIDRTIPRAFQINYLLNQVRENGPQDIESMLKLVFEEVSKTMPERPRHSASAGLVDFSRQHWQETFSRAEKLGLIKKGKNNLFELTETGNNKLNDVLIHRERILKGRVRFLPNMTGL